MENRQLRTWLFMLYPRDNPKHEAAINLLSLGEYQYIMLDHIPIIDEDGNVIKKAHTHCILFFDNPMWLSTLLNYLKLDESDSHLFKSLVDFKTGKHRKFNTIDNYIDYMTHKDNKDKPDKYSYEDFLTNCPDKVYKALNSVDMRPAESLFYLIEFMEKKIQEDEKNRYNSIKDWFKLLSINGYGDSAYRNWSKIKDMIRSESGDNFEQ